MITFNLILISNATAAALRNELSEGLGASKWPSKAFAMAPKVAER